MQPTLGHLKLVKATLHSLATNIDVEVVEHFSFPSNHESGRLASVFEQLVSDWEIAVIPESPQIMHATRGQPLMIRRGARGLVLHTLCSQPLVMLKT